MSGGPLAGVFPPSPATADTRIPGVPSPGNRGQRGGGAGISGEAGVQSRHGPRVGQLMTGGYPTGKRTPRWGRGAPSSPRPSSRFAAPQEGTPHAAGTAAGADRRTGPGHGRPLPWAARPALGVVGDVCRGAAQARPAQARPPWALGKPSRRFAQRGPACLKDSWPLPSPARGRAMLAATPCSPMGDPGRSDSGGGNPTGEGLPPTSNPGRVAIGFRRGPRAGRRQISSLPFLSPPGSAPPEGAESPRAAAASPTKPPAPVAASPHATVRIVRPGGLPGPAWGIILPQTTCFPRRRTGARSCGRPPAQSAPRSRP